VREEELAQEIVATRYITISVTVDAQANGVLNLSLGLSGKVLIRDKLYRDKIKLIMQSVPDNRDKGGRGINI